MRALLDLPAVQVVGVSDPEPKHRLRGQGIVEKVQGRRPEAVEDPRRLLERPDVDAVIVAVPCDLHESIGCEILRGEAPVRREAARSERRRLRPVAGPSRRAAPDVRPFTSGSSGGRTPGMPEGVALIRSGELGPLVGGVARPG